MSSNRLSAPVEGCHGHCFGFEHERDSWPAPSLVVRCDEQARPGYNSLDASEYQDDDDVLKAKVQALARLVRQAKFCIVYSGAGLSTDAGISDYASAATETLSGAAPPTSLRSPMCAQPTLSHRVLVALHAAGRVHRWINQNHDGLPQKAGLPQQAINEIHGAWHAPDNPVIQMSGNLRDDNFKDLLRCEQEADLVIAVGTSLAGMNADRVVTSPADRAAAKRGAAGHLGSVVIGLQRTVLDETSTLRFFARCDRVFEALARELEVAVPAPWPEGEFFRPPVLIGQEESDYCFPNIPYDAAGALSETERSTLDLREDAELVIPTGLYAGATGTVDGYDREGNVKCIFMLKAPRGKLRAPMTLIVGRWWIQAAVDGAVPLIPVVNRPADGGQSEGHQKIREVMNAYGGK